MKNVLQADQAVEEKAIPGLGAVARESLQERVYQELARSLMHGVFTAGQVLRMQALADTLQVSIMPVREALARLVSDQALEMMPNRSTRVPLITPARLEDLASVRCLIEGELVRLATQKIEEATLESLREMTAACESAFEKPLDDEQLNITSGLNYQFHFTVYGAAGSDVLLPIVRSLWMQSGPFVRASALVYGRKPSMTAVHHHWALIDALAAGDADASVAALHNDITQSFNLLRDEIAEGALDE
ncbi:GntR family transcriptional regulator [uncultured Cohaesibacter sp.]|uniref:GntR family transcriptional regulator n=1 Tax=uncultured Cohaesibacter sp. TaxID=1002546 RepID=UPI0029C7352C|nr:GntR family transcriptional regulator [uncultured Cohaesibacter sp.]